MPSSSSVNLRAGVLNWSVCDLYHSIGIIGKVLSCCLSPLFKEAAGKVWWHFVRKDRRWRRNPKAVNFSITVKKKYNSIISYMKILIITHSFATGPAQELSKYLRPRVKTLAFIDHPFSFSPVVSSSLTLYHDGKLAGRLAAPGIKAPQLLLYMKDVLGTIYFTLKTGVRFDLCVAVDNLNAFTAIFLCRLGRVRKVVFFTVDYTPRRFHSRLLNGLYHWLDGFCCRHCNSVWNSSPVMAEEREKKGVMRTKSAPQIVVPDGTDFDTIPRVPLGEINRFDIVFLGHLRESKGLGLIIEAFPEIRAQVPQARLVIVGTGPLEEKLKNEVRERNMKDYVDFKGFIESHEEVVQILARCALGIAPYVPDTSSFSYYSDVNKPKTYMACGLPVVITRVPLIASEIEQNEAGIAIDYDREQLVNAVVTLLGDDVLYQQYRKNAIRFASRFSWDRIFNEALNQTGIAEE